MGYCYFDKLPFARFRGLFVRSYPQILGGARGLSSKVVGNEREESTQQMCIMNAGRKYLPYVQFVVCPLS